MESHHAALLTESTEDLEAGGAVLAADARSGTDGALLKLKLLASGAVVMQQVEEQAPSSCPDILTSLCRRDGGLPTLIPEADIVGATTDGSDLVIWHAPLTGYGTERPRRTVRRTPPVQLDSPAAAQQAAAAVRAACCWAGRDRPPRLLVVVNPVSGACKGPATYEKQVKPVLEAAGCQAEVHVTKARGHATELVQSLDPSAYDVILAFGGDGTTHEVLQGLLSRPDWDSARGTPVAQVPCGTGNALAASTGLWTVDTAVHAVIKGQHSAFDIASVLHHSPPRRCFCFLSLCYGLISNLDVGTEHLRYLGDTRFVLGALHHIMMQKKHTVRVALLEPRAAAAAATAAAAAAAAAGGVPPLAEQQQQQQGDERAAGLAVAAAFEGPPVQHLAAFQQFAAQQLPAGWQQLPESDVTLFSACNLPRLDMNFHIAPDARLDSGHFNLLFNSPSTRLHELKVLLASEQGKHMHLVQQRRVAALALEPRSTGTWVVVDGEEVPFSPVFLEVHPGLCRSIVAPPAADGHTSR